MPDWDGSTRRETLPPDWNSRIRPAVFRRDGRRCTWLEGLPEGGFATYMTGQYNPAIRCTRPATEVDHAGDRLDHRIEACRSICHEHHQPHSGRQGGRASAAARARRRAQRFRPPEPPPGLIPT